MRPLLVLLLLALAPATAQAQIKLQPGILIDTEAGQCTANFLYDGAGPTNAGRVYLGTAAHCVEKIGEEIKDDDGTVFGRAAFIGSPDEPATDYAFIEVLPEHVGRTDPALKGHPEYPKGTATPAETAAGDLVQMSGYGVGFGLAQPTQERRQTVLQGDNDEIFWLSGPSVNGDSGGPFVHVKTGKALGIVSMYGFATASTDVGPTVANVLRQASRRGFPVTLRAAGQPAPAPRSEPAPQSDPAPAHAQPREQPAAEKPKKKRKKAKRCAKRGRSAKGKQSRRCRSARRR